MVRQYIANLLIISVFVIQVFEILYDRDDWPFSSYFMYSKPYNYSSLNYAKVYGVKKDQTEILLESKSQIYPFNTNILRDSIRKILEGEQGDTNLKLGLKDIYQRYSRRRNNQDPEIVGVRVYNMSWIVDVRSNWFMQLIKKDKLGEFLTDDNEDSKNE